MVAVEGCQRYPSARELLVLADSGGSNAALLQVCPPDPPCCPYTRHGLSYPSGASKWNPIDHRLFSEISKNWAGHPLRLPDHRRHRATGAQLVDDEYHRGVKITDAGFIGHKSNRSQLLDLSTVLAPTKIGHLFLRRP